MPAASETVEAWSELLQDKIRIIDARMAQLAALHADLDARARTACPLRPVGQAAEPPANPATG
ncbi:hypothetical protein [Streptomyces sp. NPDC051098]|uniref:hypothetical protein n=1 Tax=Streptomyces sp. NPDC051098 TaxID=3155411 RepID=UPI0034341612